MPHSIQGYLVDNNRARLGSTVSSMPQKPMALRLSLASVKDAISANCEIAVKIKLIYLELLPFTTTTHTIVKHYFVLIFSYFICHKKNVLSYELT